MATSNKAHNPFYTVLVIAGVAFGVTALAYFVMSVIGRSDPVRALESIESGHGLVAVMDKYGVTLIVIELCVLAVTTVLAITTDGYWIRRAEVMSEANRVREIQGDFEEAAPDEPSVESKSNAEREVVR